MLSTKAIKHIKIEEHHNIQIKIIRILYPYLDIVNMWIIQVWIKCFMGFNEYLKSELEYLGMPVKELAHLTGIPKQTIDKYLLSNGSMPPADKAVIIAQKLGVSVEYLVTGKKTEKIHGLSQPLSIEMRSIADIVEPLSKEKRKIVKEAVIELTNMLKHPQKDESIDFTLLQRVFLRLFR